MLASLLTTLFFALSTIFAQRSLRELGSTRANIGRLVFAFLVLGMIALVLGNAFGGAGRDWLLLSGVVGMGLGDLAFFGALPLLGSRLTVLMAQCLAAPIAALVDWLWLDTRPSQAQLLFGLVILAGVAVALMPSRSDPPRVTVRWQGFLWALGAAAGQGIGAVISRKARLVAESQGEGINGFTGAFQRIAGGLVFTLAYFIVSDFLERRRSRLAANKATGSLGQHPRPAVTNEAAAAPMTAEAAPAERPPLTLRSYRWVPVQATCGAVLGVSCYQWALFTTPSAVVLPIVATTPLVIIPLTFWLEGDRPSPRSLLGGLLAVGGAVGLALA